MFLKSIRIQHYKSLADVDLSGLKPITLLTGRNAVGKSNVVDALKFLRDIAAHGLDHAMSERGGIGIVRQYAVRKPYKINISVCFEQSFENGLKEGSYGITIASLSQGNYCVESETCVWWESEHVFDDDNQFVEFGAEKFSFSRKSDSILKFASDSETFKLPKDVAALSIRWRQRPQELIRFFSDFSFSTIYPNTLREPARPNIDRVLKENGENWASVLKSLRKTSKGKQSFERIMEMMQVVVPSLKEVNVKSVGGFLVPQFRFSDDINAKAHDFDPVQLSDGTLRVFGILLSLYQNPPPPFLAIEEPEQTIHPAMLAVLAEAFREVSEQTQIFVTSHSPHFVDYFDPDEIRVVFMKQGKTHITGIHHAQLEAIKENLMSLKELMSAEGLLPEDV